MHGLSSLEHRPDYLFQHNENAIRTGELEGKNDRMEAKNEALSNLKSKECEAEADVLQSLEKTGNGDRSLLELHDLVGKEGSICRTHNTSKDAVDLFACTELLMDETKLSAETRVIERGLPKLVEGNRDMREEIGDGIGSSPEVDNWNNKEGSMDTKQNKRADSVNPFADPANGIRFENETEVYTDKRITECQLPELIVCFKDGAYQVVKDIRIDDGLPSFEKFSVENLEVHDKGLFSFLQSDFDINDSLRDKKVDRSAIVSYQTNPFIECDCKMNVANKCSSENFTRNGEEYFDEIRDVISNQGNPFIQCDCRIGVASKCSSETLTGNDDRDFDDIGNVTTDEKAVSESFLLVQKLEEDGSSVCSEPFDFDGKGQLPPDQDTSQGTDSTDSTTPTAEESNCSEADDVPCDSKVESGSIAFDLSSSPPAMSSGVKDMQNVDCQVPSQTSNTGNTDEATVDSRTASNRSVFIQHGHGESSFAVDSLSGPIAYSGHIPYSGSISLRSDSSTTSTRSFAFPILHSEWNSSPVKMAKADRRHYRKHSGWRLSRFCCRF